MPSSSTARFRKSRTCPQTETLLTFCEGVPGAAAQVAAHLMDCEFCVAEVQLLSRHAPTPAPPHAAAHAIPSHLRRLAEDVLSEPAYNRARFAESLLEIERLTLTDA